MRARTTQRPRRRIFARRGRGRGSGRWREGMFLKSVSSQITLFPNSRCPLYKTSSVPSRTSRGEQTLNISVRTRVLLRPLRSLVLVHLHKTPGAERKDNHTRVLAARPCPSSYAMHHGNARAELARVSTAKSYFSKRGGRSERTGKKIAASDERTSISALCAARSSFSCERSTERQDKRE